MILGKFLLVLSVTLVVAQDKKKAAAGGDPATRYGGSRPGSSGISTSAFAQGHQQSFGGRPGVVGGGFGGSGNAFGGRPGVGIGFGGRPGVVGGGFGGRPGVGGGAYQGVVGGGQGFVGQQHGLGFAGQSGVVGGGFGGKPGIGGRPGVVGGFGGRPGVVGGGFGGRPGVGGGSYQGGQGFVGQQHGLGFAGQSGVVGGGFGGQSGLVHGGSSIPSVVGGVETTPALQYKCAATASTSQYGIDSTCKKFCKAPLQFFGGAYLCCDERQVGKCPPIRAQCPNQLRGLGPVCCFVDSQCQRPTEKCCFDQCLKHKVCKESLPW